MFTSIFIVSIKIAPPKKLPKTNANKFIWCTRNKVEEIRNIPRIDAHKNVMINTCK